MGCCRTRWARKTVVENMEAIFETNPIFLSGLLGDIRAESDHPVSSR